MNSTPAAFEVNRVSMLWARAEHARDICEIHGRLFPEAWNEAAILKMIEHPGSIGLVAAIANPLQIGGFALAQVAADEAEILTLGVTPDWQRKGVAGRLLSGIMRAAPKAGARALYLDVAQSNAAALALYRKAGFVETGRRKGYYVRPTGAEDAIQLRADL
jgi:[ribosomal protein S18]-alanine N-acetyltransferase